MAGIPPDAPVGTDSLVCDMSTWRSPGGAGWGPTLAWRLFQLLTVAALAWAGWRLLGHTPYRIDIDVYRMGGRAWLDGRPLYADGAMFHTRGGLDLPFTYPPLAAVAFAPFAWLSLSSGKRRDHADHPGAADRVDGDRADPAGRVAADFAASPALGSVTAEPAWLRRCWLAVAIVAPAVIYLEPIRSNFDFGQINVVLMTLVIADCVPRRTPWPRGLLLGVAIALKLTPAVFLLYFLLRRDTRALLVTAASAVVATLAGFALASAGLPGVLDRDRAQHRPHRHRDAEHQPEHRRCPGPLGSRRGRAVRAVDAGLLRGARVRRCGRYDGCCVPTNPCWR